ncbi:MAG TPA: formate dehydrogenase [Burkholderiaceae bacterium]|nr:formate dehydrogenase [Burkholderiaceae bacterium]
MLKNPANTNEKTSRRGFFLTAGTASAAVAGVVALKAPNEPEAITEILKPVPPKGGGYQLTEHVKQYYKTAMV